MKRKLKSKSMFSKRTHTESEEGKGPHRAVSLKPEEYYRRKPGGQGTGGGKWPSLLVEQEEIGQQCPRKTVPGKLKST